MRNRTRPDREAWRVALPPDLKDITRRNTITGDYGCGRITFTAHHSVESGSQGLTRLCQTPYAPPL